MNRLVLALFLALFFTNLNAQVKSTSNECINEYIKLWTASDEGRVSNQIVTKEDSIFYNYYDYSKILLEKSDFYLGFIGINKRRLEILNISAVKNPQIANVYFIIGKTQVGNNVRNFYGTIELKKNILLKEFKYGVDDFMKGKIKKQGIVIGSYTFYEDFNLTSTGIFKGNILSRWYISLDGEINYDSINEDSDSYCNNIFIGNWTSYKTSNCTTCNWGQYRIPCCGDLDIGTAEFMPNEKYYKYGWESYKP